MSVTFLPCLPRFSFPGFPSASLNSPISTNSHLLILPTSHAGTGGMPSPTYAPAVVALLCPELPSSGPRPDTTEPPMLGMVHAVTEPPGADELGTVPVANEPPGADDPPTHGSPVRAAVVGIVPSEIGLGPSPSPGPDKPRPMRKMKPLLQPPALQLPTYPALPLAPLPSNPPSSPLTTLYLLPFN